VHRAVTTGSEHDTRRVLTRYAEAWSAGDRTAIAACYHDEFTLHWFGRNPLSGDHVGKAAALRALADFSRLTRRGKPRIVTIAAAAARGVIIARESFGPAGAVVEVERVLVFSLRDDRLLECWVYDSDPALIDDLVTGGR
jgi:ketosteroid isomerase-like protein